MNSRVRLGIDNLSRVDGALRGRRVGLITAPTGVNGRLDSTIDILAARYRLTALFACEHGVRGTAQAGERVESEADETGVPVHSLYGKTRRMTGEMLDSFDVLVYDIQDVGARFYTYLYTLSYAMEACAAAGKSLVVLDRPNPLGGAAEGTLLDERFHSFVGEYAMPTRYGLTVGEYALFVKAYLKLDLDLLVCPMEGWRRGMLCGETGLCFVPPSPNIPTPQTALCYIGVCPFEGTNLSEGRGTTTPFEWVGAPWLDARRVLEAMRRRALPGVLFRRAAFTPTFSKFAGTPVNAIALHVTDPAAFRPFECGLLLLDEIRRQSADFQWLAWNTESGGASHPIDRILGSDEFRLGASAEEIITKHAPLVADFAERARAFHLYS